MSGFLTPDPRLRELSDLGVVLPGAKLHTYVAGTPSTPLATYSDSALTVANANPVIASAGGLFGPIYLTPNVAYKFLLTDALDVTVPGYPQDNIVAPGLGALTAHGVLIGAGSGAVVATSAGIAGQVLTSNGPAADPTFQGGDTGLDEFRLTLESGVPVSYTDQLAKSTLYCTPYRGTRIALYDATGVAAILASAQVSIALPAVANTNYDVFVVNVAGVLTLELLAFRNSGQAITGATTATPIVITANAHGLSNGDEVYIDGVFGNTPANGTWTVANVTANTYELTGSVGAGAYTAATGWFNARTAAGKLTLATTGTYTKIADLTRRYKGLVRTGTVAGQSEDSLLKRYCWNVTNRVHRTLQRFETTASWPYTLAVVRQANGAVANQVDVVVGVAEALLDLTLNVVETNSSDSILTSAGIGEDSTTQYTVGTQLVAAAVARMAASVRLAKPPLPGRHSYSWNEWSTASGVTTWHANTAAAGSTITAGLAGWIEG